MQVFLAKTIIFICVANLLLDKSAFTIAADF